MTPSPTAARPGSPGAPGPGTTGSAAVTGIPAGRGRDELVTGEALAVDLPGAGIGLRTLSGLLDVVVTLLLGVGLALLLVKVFDEADEAFVAGVSIVAVATLLVALPTALETLTGGRTLGKLATGLRTVRDDGGPADLRRYATRHLVGSVEVWGLFGWPALLTALVTRRTKRLGDLVAGTVVVRDRRALPPPAGVAMPPRPEVAAWARGAQISTVPADVLARARHLHRYAGGFDPATRARLVAATNREILAHVAPPPPPNAPPELVFLAVLARRRELDTLRLDREDRTRERLFGREHVDRTDRRP